MKLNIKRILLGLLLPVILVIVGGCAEEVSPYDQNDQEGYRVSVRYDANGGTFTTNTSVIVDSYDPGTLPQSGGKASVALLAPDNAARGNDAFTAVHNGYFLAGWYAERTESKDAEGNVTYTYGGKWNFETDRLEVDPNGSYTASQPVLTLYAAWVPLFEVEFYDRASGELLDSYSFDPSQGAQLQVPGWDAETGVMEMHHFPQRPGYTFDSVFYDAAGTKPVTTDTIEHTGKVDEATGTANDSVMKLYVDFMEGEWYRIETVEQFLDNASVSGCYEILADLDFTDEIWPSNLVYGNYTGTIRGNGHTISNVQLRQTNTAKENAGLFGYLTETARISDLKLENITFTIESGSRVTGTSFGLLAGTISSGAQITGVTIVNGLVQIDSDCYFSSDEYYIGLLCGTGTADVDYSDIRVEATGRKPENVKISVTGQTVDVQIELT